MNGFKIWLPSVVVSIVGAILVPLIMGMSTAIARLEDKVDLIQVQLAQQRGESWSREDQKIFMREDFKPLVKRMR